jgi:hypothetical protein
MIEFHGKHAEILADWSSKEICAEGSLSCGKTTVALWKELEALQRWPGIWSLITRWTDDACRTLLRPAFEQLARIHGTTLEWNDKEHAYELENHSRVFCFGLKTQSQLPTERYGKIRGLPVSRIYADQAEQVLSDIADELRLRLRPDIEARLRKEVYPTQLTFTPNPVNDDHWIAKQFPLNNRIKGRRHWTLSLFDNAHNLPAEMIEQALQTYPPEHPKHRTVILGQRGLNVIGDPIYENLFDRTLHVRELTVSTALPLIEAFHVGRHNPVWVIAQRTYFGGMSLLGGIIGKRMMLEDFLPLVKRIRADWFPNMEIRTCTSPMGETSNGSGRYTLLGLLRNAGFQVIWRENANAPDVQLATIEHVAGLLRRRTMRQEALGINSDPSRWLSASSDGTVAPVPFMAFAFEGGYVWSDHAVSISNKTVRQPHDDDEYANAMRCLENLVLNFSADIQSQSEADEQRRKARERSFQQDSPMSNSPNSWMSS